MKKLLFATLLVLILCLALTGLCETSPFKWYTLNEAQTELTISLGQAPNNGYTWNCDIEKSDLLTASDAEYSEATDKSESSEINGIWSLALTAAKGQEGKTRVWFKLNALGVSEPAEERCIEVTVGKDGVLSVKQPSLTLREKNVPLYLGTPDDIDNINLYYKDDREDIPYIQFADALRILNSIHEDEANTVYAMMAEQDRELFYLERENGASIMLDFDKKELIWDDYDLFNCIAYTATYLDILSSKGLDKDGNPAYFSRNVTPTIRKGDAVSLDFNIFDIELIFDNGMGYLPLQTASDLFFAPYLINSLYNGECVILLAGIDITPFKEIYYSVPTGERSPELAEFNYNELCLALQINYGLKEAHNLPSFDTLFEQTGLTEKLMSPDPVVADTALSDLTVGYIGDMHSSFCAPSHYAGDVMISPVVISPSLTNSIINMTGYSTMRLQSYPDGIKGYEEVGNTAYVTFDSFLVDYERDYYKEPATAEDTDTIGLLMYAHSQITREGSPVENVVIDLSNNGGGMADAAIYTIAWYLGDCTINIEDTLTGSQASVSYKIDANCDHEFDENDSVGDKNLYCLISPSSFSCGNLVPSAFKASGIVTLLGRHSGGGACVVQPLSTADGSFIRISGIRRISTVSNGSFYDVDKGVEPDFVITRVSRFYDRVALTDYINSLY